MRNIKNSTDIRGSMRSALSAFLLLWAFGTVSAQQVLVPAGHASLTDKQNHYLQELIKEPTAGAYEIVEVLVPSIKGEHLTLDILGTTYAVRQSYTVERGKHDYSWFGRTPDGRGSAVLVVNGDMVTGQMTLDFQQFSLMPLGGGLHVVMAIVTSEFPHDENDESYRKRAEKAGVPVLDHVDYDNDPAEAAAPKAINNCSIRYLIAYTTAVDNALADVHGFIQSCIDSHNQINGNSLADHNVELARSILVSYNEVGGDFETDLERFKATADGNMDNIHAVRTLYDADVCQLIVNTGSGCGLAYGIGSSFSTAFAVTKRSCAVDNYTFTHESGHLYGARHDPYVDDNNSPFPFGHGYVKTSGSASSRWRTCMSYNDQCADLGADCPRLPYWSNPTITYSGNAMGTVLTHYNALVTRSQEDVLAGYEARITNKLVTNNTVLDEEWGNIEGINTLTSPGGTGTAVTYNSGSKGNYRAGVEVILTEGFWARAGTDFVAYLGSCSNPQYLAPPAGEIFAESNAQKESSDPGAAPGGNILGNASGQAMDVKVFPNPFSENTFIDVACSSEDQVSISVHNMLGVLVLQPYKGLAPITGTMRIEAQMGGMPSGMYIVNVLVNDVQSVHRVVKNK